LCDNTAVIEVHNGHDSPGPLWFHVGKIDGSGDITWNTNAYSYAGGWNPSVAAYGTTIVEVDNDVVLPGLMWYHLGQLVPVPTQIQLTGLTVGWSPGFPLSGSGWNPSVAVSGSTVVEVHNGQSTFGQMYSRVGTISNGYINWGPITPYDQGLNPQITVLGSTVIEVHNGQNTPGKMWYRVGQITGTATKTINWNPSVPYDSGWNPKISYGPYGLIEVHNGEQTAGQMYYDYGSLSGSAIVWNSRGDRFDSGLNPSVTTFGNSIGALEVHNGGNGQGEEWYNLGAFIYPPSPPPPLQ